MNDLSLTKLATIHIAVLLVLLAGFTLYAFLAPVVISAMSIYLWLVPVYALYLGGFYIVRAFQKKPVEKGKKI